MLEHYLDIRFISAGIGGFIGGFIGPFDKLLFALIIFIAVDYVTGVLCAILERNLSSTIGFKGLCQKVFILLLVGIANVLDVNVIGGGSIIRSAVICFYISNEGISIFENAGRIGLPIPHRMQKAMKQLRKK